MEKVNSVILVDKSDEKLGELFSDLKNATDFELRKFAKDNHIVCQTMTLGSACDKYSIVDSLSKVNERPFLFFVYAHGREDAIVVEGECVISSNENYYVLSNAVVYTLSCYNGGELADMLLDNKLRLFVGYRGKANCPYGMDDRTLSIGLSFVIAFLEGKTASESFDVLYDSYTKSVRDTALDPFQRAAYQESRDALVMKGDGNIQIKDLLIA